MFTKGYFAVHYHSHRETDYAYCYDFLLECLKNEDDIKEIRYHSFEGKDKSYHPHEFYLLKERGDF